ncbi:MAG: M48 family metalloprotease [Gammaproteobacteria bacterium]|nr:M48 family metalloprotease [Gammaproteobacteria bacterium]
MVRHLFLIRRPDHPSMEYTNPELPEGINTSKQNPLKEFAILTLGMVGVLFISLTLLILLVDYFADKIPFDWERSLPVTRFLDSKNSEKLPLYLEQVSQQVIQSLDLPESMTISVHYVNSDTVNAFATLGGHIVLYRGLLEKLGYEDELSMVIAHEVAHIKYRHPILSASHGVVTGLVLSFIGLSSGDGVVSDLLGSVGMATMIKYSRDYEYQADSDAVESLIRIYGHADGAMGLFNIFDSAKGDIGTVEFLSTHPLTKNRITQVGTMIEGRNILNKNDMIPLPQAFKDGLKQP